MTRRTRLRISSKRKRSRAFAIAATTMSGGLFELFEESTRRGVLLLMSDLLVDDLEDVFAALRLSPT